ncbi:hypothetical protein [Longimicrobium terrae]|uniref:Uncharacterized protein n=1 Tax=Longimicrobium terrae TaxID=1639882 RepID=A0A841H2W6_9BACT|nr:hypothetical protein [Longimicrobium terrae]MBB4637879.1 hypothetical protein [Longimicrobium terrae]MBB6072266.1 hypothetical protein [Longimicrobium terrae]NNC31188.1 hypothetical protein [Longimicrobium terrae]
MKKLILQLDDLRIESFSTTATPHERGTVVGEEQCTCPTACSCPGCPTCDASCNGTCGGTCDASCYGTCDFTCEGCGDDSAGHNTCDRTCQGFQTYGAHGDMCVIC